MSDPWASHRTHLGVGSNDALCQHAQGVEPGKQTAVWGHWLTKDREDVDCERCLEWMHA